MKIVVVGSGISAAHAALTLLERGRQVEMWDVGREEAAIPAKGATFHALKEVLDEPEDYFLGGDLRALVPTGTGELLRYPPSRSFLIPPDDPLWPFLDEGFAPFGSYAQGGLANGWGANALSYDEDDLADWPVSFADMDEAYRKVYARVPVAAPDADDLTPYLAGVHPTQAPVQLARADRRLLASYGRRRSALARLGVRIGHARLAVVTDPAREDHCDYCDRCLWGCPHGAIYNPVASTLETCKNHPRFTYRPGRLVLSLLAAENRVTGIRYLDTVTRQVHEEACDAVFLAAGALQTGAVFLRTLRANRPGIAPETVGLMDTTVVKLPFLALNCIGLPADERAFQFNRLNVGLVDEDGPFPRYLHGELLNLTSLLYHPLIESLPVDSRFAKRLFFALRSALGVVTLFFPDRLTAGNRQALVDRDGRWEDVALHYHETGEKTAFVKKAVAKTRSALWRLGCIPRGIVKSPPGAGIHYAGTVPMGKGPKRCNAEGQSNLFSNLYLADGAAFPSLPSKSISISLAAHATRVAATARL